MDRILFLIPPYVTYQSYIAPGYNERTVRINEKMLGSVIANVPIGLLSLSSYLKHNIEVKVKLIDFNVILNNLNSFDYGSFQLMFKEILSMEEWVKYNPTVIGISALFAPSYYNMLNLADEARNIYKDSLILCGGGIPTNMFKEIFKENKTIDALCFGEGEKPLLSLLKSNDKKKYMQINSSWITREKKWGGKFEYDFVEDLDEIPILDYELIKLPDYSKNSIQSLFPLSERKSSFSTMTSRGCRHYCSFCSSHSVHGRKMRYYSIKRIKKDFKLIKEKMGASALTIFDDHFMANKKRALEILEILRELDLKASFPNSLALYALDKKILRALKNVGMNHIVLSVESGSERVLKEIMHKPLNLAIVDRVISDCRDLGIATDVAVLIGLPGETKEDIENAREFFKSIKPNWFRFSMATPLVGSEMLELCIKHGYLKGDYLKCDFKKPIVGTEEFTPEYIQETAYLMNLELNFVLNSDIELGKYSTALTGFENTIKVRNDHAFAYYFAALCCQKLNKIDKYYEYKNSYFDVCSTSDFWREKVNLFNLEPLPN